MCLCMTNTPNEILEKSKTPAPPRLKAELRQGKALPTSPWAHLPLPQGGVGRALPCLSSAFGRGGVNMKSKNIMRKFCNFQ